MKNIFIIFWAVMIFSSIAWYAFLLFYVCFKGGREIGRMTRKLKQQSSPGPKGTSGP